MPHVGCWLCTGNHPRISYSCCKTPLQRAPDVMFGDITSGVFFMSASPCSAQNSVQVVTYSFETSCCCSADVDAVIQLRCQMPASSCTSCCRMMLLTASTKPQFATGPQKCVVLGPVKQSKSTQRGVSGISSALTRLLQQHPQPADLLGCLQTPRSAAQASRKLSQAQTLQKCGVVCDQAKRDLVGGPS